MKTLTFIIFLILGSFSTKAQIQDRVVVLGTLQMPPGDETRGISVFNLNTSRGTVTNARGEFKIPLAVNDSLRVSAIQFQEFTIVIDQGIIDTGEIIIQISEVVNFLPDVIVSPYDLTGNVRVDIKRISVTPDPDSLNAMNTQNMYFEIDGEPNYQANPRNIAQDIHQAGLTDGLNFANLFRYLLVTRKRAEIERVDRDLNAEVRELYDDQFFRDNLGIEMENIPNFITYVDDNGLGEEMLVEGNELDLIEFLVQQSRRYKKEIDRK